jgi:hypothetical protein
MTASQLADFIRKQAADEAEASLHGRMNEPLSTPLEKAQ